MTTTPPAPVTEPNTLSAPAEAGNGTATLPQWRLMLRRFLKSRLAVASSVVLAVLYVCAILAPFLSPNPYDRQDADLKNAPPTAVIWSGGPAICSREQQLDTETFTYEYSSDCGKPVPLRFFGKGHEYKLFGLISTDRHLVTVDKPHTLLFWGADSAGRDVFARSMQGARVSLTIGLLGVAVGTFLGATIGTISGYFRGAVDTLLQRFIELLMSLPTLPLWLALAAILPQDMSVASRYFLITLILSLVGWASLARQIRGKVMSYAASDYVAAARIAGSSSARIVFRHLIPNASSHIVATAMLAVPATIIAETSLSFLGVGMLPPAVSWGVLLSDAQNVATVQQYPWLLIPAALVVLAVTCFQLIGDGLRDAVDPYG
ncbi:peptide/nickel transport system permease protein [Nonomuraea polychroma]|uniref:Peptide/nickel transport system permease protein n=1 Tax=Nonomuraea polychroma TaxID=46176 RepID=A0A438MEA3_9ACTN|nr:ABC transporter permease [Nonomuraea polychroma]RVX43875.1 peptide/nickel transport system permease protein [Nonomuraea polychroma]